MNIVGWKMRIDGMFVTPAWIALIALAITSGCTKTDSGRADGGDKVSILIDNAARGSSKNIRISSAESMFDVISKLNKKNLNEKDVIRIEDLLSSEDDEVIYWAARSLGELGAEAKVAVPKMREVLARTDCLRGSKTSASGIRFALQQIGEKPPYPTCAASPR